ncbi:MAG: phospholipase D-like domain-containing protein, partial [Candidatus Omnitrophica bacterium]|nr:phospholipase D-like domain-containing protein [Candidatus Omnitrophota bacterium]
MALLSLRRKLGLFLIILASLIFVFSPLSAQEGLLPAQVKDISDRAYEPAIIELLDGAKESIVISMYNISLGTKERNPIVFLLNDLIEARQRNVAVTIYLNTRFREIDKGSYQLIRTAFFKKLLDTGCLIHLLPARLRLHDKLIIVDSRFVVEGSTNWSISALKSNRESATLIDSPELAKIKLLRLK